MASTTGNRHYPFPVPADAVDVSGDLQRLAQAVDTDMTSVIADYIARFNTEQTARANGDTNLQNALTAEQVGRIGGDTNLQNDYIARDQNIVIAKLGTGARNTGILMQGGYVECVYSGFSTFLQNYPQPFLAGVLPVVQAGNATNTPQTVHPAAATGQTVTGITVIARNVTTGNTIPGSVGAFWWLAVGFV